MKAATTLLAALVVACGSKGSSGESETPPETPASQTPGVVEQVVSLTGTVYLGDTATPAAGHEVWILDHTDSGMARLPLPDGGRLDVPLKIFRVGHTYTVHLVKDDHLLGTFDFGDDTVGTQASLVYDGGYGFDLGDVIAKVTSRGEVDVDDPGLSCAVGGGFSVDVRSTDGFATLHPPDGVTTFHLRSRLNVFDPATLLYAFYNRASFPERYAAAVREHSGLIVSATTRSKKTVSRISLVDGGEWLEASRLSNGTPDATRGSSPFWSTSSYALPATDEQSFRADVFTGEALIENSIAVFKIQPVTGPSLLMPRILGPMRAMPPRPTAIALDGGTPVAIDYTPPSLTTATAGTGDAAATQTAANTATETFTSTSTTRQGLLMPFCYADNGVTIVYDPPRNRQNEPMVDATYDLVTISLDYFGDGDDGRSQSLTVKAADYSGAFAAAYTATGASASDPTRSWDPEKRSVTFRWSESAAAELTEPTLELWPELFPEKVEGGDVSKMRLRVYFRSTADPGEAASAIWLQRGC